LVFICSVLAHIESAKLSASDANSGDSFGISVAIDGNTVVVGSYQNDSNGPDCGAAYVYELFGSQWLHLQKLTPSDGFPGDNFGRSVAIEGNTIVVGSYNADNNKPNTGAAYIFTRLGDVWTLSQKLTAPDSHTGDKFGGSVSISNDTIVIGAYGDNSYTGSACVFLRTGDTWTFQQKLTASDAAQNDHFGYSVAVDNNTIVIGAHNRDHSGYMDAGSAYVYRRQDSVWLEQSILHASDSGLGAHFGYSLALDGNLAVIGAYECDTNIAPRAGAAYVFAKVDADWVEQQKLFDANDPNNGEDFGWSVAVEKDTILAGCTNDSPGGKQTGSVFEFTLVDSAWIQTGRLTAADSNAEDKFGSPVAVSGRNIIIGAPYNYNNGKSTGSAYVFGDALTADFDGDSDVDFCDFAVLASSWLQSNPLVDIAPPPAGDGIVDIKDLAVLCDNWLAGK